ncbi:uncharacterized protein LOC126792747 isoform X2 [Argentina anserina]|uniref:uncharacterized protein LOC126792747 isoform X2 n=1 Tax=Argentina anserina TaxID=57926 RepID=UPI0021768711|nr:uncharacterized protein LOC126792747 isoform X2 [Potentilla anserina]
MLKLFQDRMCPDSKAYSRHGDEDDVQFCPDPWVESDGEDFFSVKNDLAPSTRESPIHKNSEIIEVETPNVINHKNKSKVQPVKQLIELFRESFNADESGGHRHMHYKSEAESSPSDMPRSSANVSPYRYSVTNLISGARTRKATQFAQCFLPKMVQIISFSERKKC